MVLFIEGHSATGAIRYGGLIGSIMRYGGSILWPGLHDFLSLVSAEIIPNLNISV